MRWLHTTNKNFPNNPRVARPRSNGNGCQGCAIVVRLCARVRPFCARQGSGVASQSRRQGRAKVGSVTAQDGAGWHRSNATRLSFNGFSGVAVLRRRGVAAFAETNRFLHEYEYLYRTRVHLSRFVSCFSLRHRHKTPAQNLSTVGRLCSWHYSVPSAVFYHRTWGISVSSSSASAPPHNLHCASRHPSQHLIASAGAPQSRHRRAG